MRNGVRRRIPGLVWVTGCLVLVACGAGGDPASVVRGFIEAGRSGDREKALEYVVIKERVTSNVLVHENPDLEYRLGRVRRDGERRIVPVTVSEAGDRLELEMVLVREGDAWRISIDQTLDLKKDALLEEVRRRRGDIDRALPADE